MSECNLVFGAVNNGKEVPNSLSVHGSIYLYGENDQIVIREATSQGINERILILDIEIIENGGPQKGVCQNVYWKTEVQGREFDQVTIRIVGSDDQTIDVRYFG